MNSPCVFRKRDTKNYLAFIEITNSCNMRCKHCMNWSVKDSNNGFNKENILKLIKELKDINTEEIYISGGEPLIYPYIDDVILYAHELGIKVTIATNALEVPNHLETIKEGVQLVSISFDGIGKTHDNLRGVPGAYDNCIAVFKLLHKNNIKVRISAMIWKDNINELEEMIKEAKECGVSKVNLAFLIPEGRAKDDEDIKLPEGEYLKIIDKVNMLKEKYVCDDFNIELRRIKKLDNNSMDCFGGYNLLHINVNGKVSPCSWISKLDKENRFSFFWPETSLNEGIKKFDEFRKLNDDRKKKYGYTGCPALSYIYNDDFLAEDPLNKMLGEK